MKKEAMDKVMTAIRRVLAGEMYISEKIAAQMVQKLIGRGATPSPPHRSKRFQTASSKSSTSSLRASAPPRSRSAWA